MPNDWPSPASLPDLSDHQREQYAKAAHGCLSILGGRPGCLHAATNIFDPVDGSTTSVEGREAAGVPFHVYARTLSGTMVVAQADVPWRYNPAGMRRFTFRSGRTITVTDGHRFWCGESYVSAWQIFQHLRVFGSFRLPTILAPGLSTYHEDELCYQNTTQDSQSCCSVDFHQCDERLPLKEAIVRSSSPLRDDALQQPHALLRSDGRGRRHTNIRLPDGGHHANTRCVSRSALRFGSELESHGSAELHELLPLFRGPDGLQIELKSPGSITQQPLQSVIQANDAVSPPSVFFAISNAEKQTTYAARYSKSDGACLRSAESTTRFGSRQIERQHQSSILRALFLQSCFRSSVEYTQWDEVVKVEDAGIHPYFDFHVPGFGNYWAEGFFHHNTGKTFSLARILAHIPHGRCGVAAPTGKAAVRITESLERAGVRGLRATTIHSLLGPGRDEETDTWAFKHNEGNPLDLDWIFVDEASMVDCPLLGSLLAARAPGARLMLIGDVNQLAPVGFGAPLRDLIAAGLPYGELTEIRRNAGRIVRCCHGIIDKHAFEPSPKLDLAAESPENLLHIEKREPEAQIETLKTVLDRFRQGATVAIRHEAMPDREAWIEQRRIDPVWDCQVVVPVNEKSPLCRIRLNQILQGFLNSGGEQAAGSPFRVGDKIVCGKNGWTPCEQSIPKGIQGGPWNTAAKDGKVYVANGEAGRVLAVFPRYTIARLWMPDRIVRIPRGESFTNEDGEEENTGCSWDLAFAMSVHKSQGSQWPVVITIADAYPGARMLCDRSWLYTALSRAETLAITIGQRDVLDDMCRKSHIWQRKTFLRETIAALQQQSAIQSWEAALA